jgi:hypothetical protein
LVRNIPLNNPFSNTSAHVVPFVRETKYCTHTDMYKPVWKCWLKHHVRIGRARPWRRW